MELLLCLAPAAAARALLLAKTNRPSVNPLARTSVPGLSKPSCHLTLWDGPRDMKSAQTTKEEETRLLPETEARRGASEWRRVHRTYANVYREWETDRGCLTLHAARHCLLVRVLLIPAVLSKSEGERVCAWLPACMHIERTASCCIALLLARRRRFLFSPSCRLSECLLGGGRAQPCAGK
jgi:hypothetical protein